MQLLLIRHGETAYNAEQLALGQADIPLTERGHRQARALADAVMCQIEKLRSERSELQDTSASA